MRKHERAIHDESARGFHFPRSTVVKLKVASHRMSAGSKANMLEVRVAKRKDCKFLHKMPPYSEYNFKSYPENIVLVAETDEGIVGAVTIGQKEIFYSSSLEPEKTGLRSSANTMVPKTCSRWISKLFVFPEHRCHGTGTQLVAAAVQLLRDKAYKEAYSGVNVENECREVSERIFLHNGFEKIGYCNCLLPQKSCRGTLFKKTLKLLETGHADERLTDEIRSLGLSMGAELVGFTSTAALEREAPEGHKPSSLLPTAKSMVVLACGRKLNEDRHYFYRWGPHFSLAYIRLTDELKEARREARQCIDGVKNYLEGKGFKVAAEPHGWSGILSFKMAAYSAGLGVFGKGGFVVNPTLGPLNVLACVLTDATLVDDAPLRLDVCKDCTKCIKACKYAAYKRAADGYRWVGEKCRSYDLIMNPVTSKWTYGPCNSKCVHACPIGKGS